MLKTLIPALGLIALATSAAAHISVDAAGAAPGATTKITLRVPHGCDGAATTGIRVTLPDGVYGAKPMPKPGWTLETTSGAYATPYDDHGTQTAEGVREIAWSGGDLPDAFYDEFTFRASLGGALDPDAALYFPIVQDCGAASVAWSDTSGSHDVAHLAPAMTLAAGTAADAHGGHGDHMAPAPASYTVGDLTITAPFSRATVPNAPVGGGYLTVTNTGTQDDRLISASSPAAGRMEVHEMSMEGDVMRMRALEGGLPIPAGETVELKPGGYHIMLMDLAGPLVEGTDIPVTLTFEKAGSVEVVLPVGSRNARKAEHEGHMDHGDAAASK